MTRLRGQHAPPYRVILLGSTGSIGTQTLDVIERLNAMPHGGPRFDVVGLAARRNATLLAEQARRFGVRDLAIADADLPGVRRGPSAAEDLVRSVECDLVVAAMVGIAGLAPTLAALDAGRNVALANKEALVAAGGLVLPLATRQGCALRPIDSEHAALWQCLLAGSPGTASDANDLAPPRLGTLGVRRAIITASGGPFRGWSKDRIERAEPADALRHPTWSMGPKVTIDSASLMNKALELIEAHWLFGLDADRLGVLVHPRSIAHAMVEFVDGSAIAQLATPDMRVPIQRSLTFPAILPGPARALPALEAIEFEPPDLERFPALMLGDRVIREGGLSGAVLNGANEAAVEAYLAGRAAFGAIPRLARDALDHAPAGQDVTLEHILDADAWARDFVRRRTG